MHEFRSPLPIGFLISKSSKLQANSVTAAAGSSTLWCEDILDKVFIVFVLDKELVGDWFPPPFPFVVGVDGECKEMARNKLADRERFFVGGCSREELEVSALFRKVKGWWLLCNG